MHADNLAEEYTQPVVLTIQLTAGEIAYGLILGGRRTNFDGIPIILIIRLKLYETSAPIIGT